MYMRVVSIDSSPDCGRGADRAGPGAVSSTVVSIEPLRAPQGCVLHLRNRPLQNDMPNPSPSLLYLDRAAVENLRLPMSEIVACVETAFREKAAGRTQMPAKHWMEVPGRWIAAQSSLVPAAKAAAVKWQTGAEANAARGLPYLNGLLILNDLDSGLPVAVMDSTWLTAKRTAAATAVAVKHLGRGDARRIAILGCGVQGRAHAEALRLVCPGATELHAYDLAPATAAAYVRDVARDHGYDARVCGSAREAIEAGEIVVTGGPIVRDAVRIAGPGWLAPGALAVTLDYDCYWQAAALDEADRFVTDDVPQYLHLQEGGFFEGVRHAPVELCDIVAGRTPGRVHARERIVCINMGIAVEDAVTARSIYDAAVASGAGTALPL